MSQARKLPVSNISPFLRWAGSKRQLLPLLSSYWNNQYERYVEPFAGSACLFFHLRPRRAILGDVNADLIATYKQVKYQAHEVISSLKLMNKGRKEYYKLRGIDPDSLSPTARAARFIYLNRFCFNGLYRTNRSGHFNVPYGGEKAGNIPSDSILQDCSRALKNTSLVAGDFERVLGKIKQGDFVYMDPPFSVKARRVFNEYDASTFNSSDLKRLRQWMEKLVEMRITFLVSYAECEEADYLRKGFFTRIVTVKRNIAGFTASRTHSNELLISSVPLTE